MAQQNMDFIGTVEEGRCLYRIAKFWYRILQMEEEELLKCCCDWHIGNLKQGRYAASLREELYKIGMGYIWQNGKDWDIKVIDEIIYILL
jgi:hypothetical protein